MMMCGQVDFIMTMLFLLDFPAPFIVGLWKFARFDILIVSDLLKSDIVAGCFFRMHEGLYGFSKAEVNIQTDIVTDKNYKHN